MRYGLHANIKNFAAAISIAWKFIIFSGQGAIYNELNEEIKQAFLITTNYLTLSYDHPHNTHSPIQIASFLVCRESS